MDSRRAQGLLRPPHPGEQISGTCHHLPKQISPPGASQVMLYQRYPADLQYCCASPWLDKPLHGFWKLGGERAIVGITGNSGDVSKAPFILDSLMGLEWIWFFLWLACRKVVVPAEKKKKKSVLYSMCKYK